MSKPKSTRILAFDTSLARPGAAIIEIKRKKPTISALSHVSTDTSLPHGQRAQIVESWARMFIYDNLGKYVFTHITREDFSATSSKQAFPVFAAWDGCERAVNFFGLTFDKFEDTLKSGKRKTYLGVPQSKVKRLVCGNGSATKDEVEAAVRRLTGYRGEFAVDDESDAAAIALAWAIQNDLTKAKEGD